MSSAGTTIFMHCLQDRFYFNFHIHILNHVIFNIFLSLNNDDLFLFLILILQSYIHGSSQAQFVAESHIILLLSILQKPMARTRLAKSEYAII